MKRIAITGGAGFVGSSLAILLKQHKTNVDVVCFDNLSRRGSELNLPRLKEHGITFIQGDVRNPEDFERLGIVDWLLECSAEPSVHAGYGQSPRYLINTNLNGLLNCLEYLRQHGGHCVFLSSSRVYPIPALRALPLTPNGSRFELSGKGISENFTLNGPRSLYGATKLSGELFVEEYCHTYGLNAIINRCGVLAGPWQMGKVDQGFMALWVASHLYNGSLKYMGFGGEGLQVRDVLHVSDLFNLLMIQMENIEDHNGVVYNVGGGMENSVSLRELSEKVSAITGRTLAIGSDPDTRQADIPYYVSDCSKIFEKTNWKPTQSVDDIIVDIYAWINKHHEMLKPIFT